MKTKLNKYKLKNLDVVFLLLISVLTTFSFEFWHPKFIIALFVVHFIILLVKRRFKICTTPFFWMLISLYCLNFTGLTYTEHLEKGFTVITRQMSFLLFPLFYATYHLRNPKLLLKIYCVAIFVLLVISEIYTVYRFFYLSDIFPLNLELFLSFRYTGAELTRLLGIHNAYLGMYIILSNILIVQFLRTTKSNLYSLLLLFVIVFQSLFIMQMVSKTAIILNILIIIPSLIYFLIKLKKFKTLLFLALMVFGIGYFTVTKFNLPLDRIVERAQELVNKDKTNRETRAVIWESATPLIKENIIFGLGTGDANKTLVKKFEKDGLKTNTNVHNQYLDYVLRFGVVGLLLFLFVLGYAIYQSIKLDNYVYFCFLVLILGSCFTENIFSRQMGILFFAIFNYMFYLIAIKTYKWQ